MPKLYKGESLSGENQTDQLYLYLTKTHPCLKISFDREIKFQKGNFLSDIPNCAEVFLGKHGGCLLRSFVEAGKYFTFPLIAPLLSQQWKPFIITMFGFSFPKIVSNFAHQEALLETCLVCIGKFSEVNRRQCNLTLDTEL